MQFSANLKFLWADLILTEAIFHAASAGSSVVGCLRPKDTMITAISNQCYWP
jgi:hydroxypyruvate isomerase